MATDIRSSIRFTNLSLHFFYSLMFFYLFGTFFSCMLFSIFRDIVFLFVHRSCYLSWPFLLESITAAISSLVFFSKRQEIQLKKYEMELSNYRQL